MTDLQKELEIYFDKLWPICRSITGNGLRESFKILQDVLPLRLTEIPTGTKCFDWEIPKEWNITDAYIITPEGEKIADFKVNNLHVVNYSIPVNTNLSFEELDQHLYSIPELPDAIPYITSYYKENWGFCITHQQRIKLNKEGRYQVVINSSLTPGSLTYGDLVLEGETNKEILFSSYLCHPSMANNELSGPLCMAFLYQKIAALKNRKYTYRFVLAPETIGVIAYLAKYGLKMKENTIAGYVLTCCGDNGPFVYKQSKDQLHLVNRVAKHVLKHQNQPYEVIPFAVGGSDERQYCSPGFNLPVGSLTRSMYQRYKEYHTSLDNKAFISFPAMENTINTYFNIVCLLEDNGIPENKQPYCEPQLGKRGLYPNSVTPMQNRKLLHGMMHLISFADGTKDLLEILDLDNLSYLDFKETITKLYQEEILINNDK